MLFATRCWNLLNSCTKWYIDKMKVLGMKDKVLFIRFQVRWLVVHRLCLLRRPTFPLQQMIATLFGILPPIDGVWSGLQTRHSTTRQNGCTKASSVHHFFIFMTHFVALGETTEARDSDSGQYVRNRNVRMEDTRRFSVRVYPPTHRWSGVGASTRLDGGSGVVRWGCCVIPCNACLAIGGVWCCKDIQIKLNHLSKASVKEFCRLARSLTFEHLRWMNYKDESSGVCKIRPICISDDVRILPFVAWGLHRCPRLDRLCHTLLPRKESCTLDVKCLSPPLRLCGQYVSRLMRPKTKQQIVPNVNLQGETEK